MNSLFAEAHLFFVLQRRESVTRPNLREVPVGYFSGPKPLKKLDLGDKFTKTCVVKYQLISDPGFGTTLLLAAECHNCLIDPKTIPKLEMGLVISTVI